MDISLISGAMTALSATVEIGKAAMEARDANKLAATIAEMNDKVLSAQQVLLRLSMEAMATAQDLANCQQEIHKLKAALEQRGNYTLVELDEGHFVLRSKSQAVRDGMPVEPPEPVHHVCQPCFDKGVKSVLQRWTHYGTVYLRCTLCKGEWDTGETVPYSM